jgi:hypothetical protein
MASQRLAPLIHARVQAAVLAQGEAPALVAAAVRPARAGQQPSFCHIPQEIVALLRQEAMLRVGLDGPYRSSPSSFDPACLTSIHFYTVVVVKSSSPSGHTFFRWAYTAEEASTQSLQCISAYTLIYLLSNDNASRPGFFLSGRRKGGYFDR